jgi:hypothetical protein
MRDEVSSDTNPSLPSPTSRSGDTYSRRYRLSRIPAITPAFSSTVSELL